MRGEPSAKASIATRPTSISDRRHFADSTDDSSVENTSVGIRRDLRGATGDLTARRLLEAPAITDFIKQMAFTKLVQGGFPGEKPSSLARPVASAALLYPLERFPAFVR